MRLSWLCMLALTLRLVVPTGYMPVMSHGRMVVSICSGNATRSMLVTIPGLEERPGEGRHDDRDQHGAPCAYAGLSMLALDSATPVLVRTAPRFMEETGLLPPPVSTAGWRAGLRPWVRGPPARA
ncbi:DUF2946 family protein [Sphingomonas sp. Leaf4]|uniref:DUF2946 family protein n=1 Tax=Sphingomonas sp. Leaf4 TaxID=2876553 RepID=UPI001E2C57E8|nr:DUF2946 family protein [Sphingomonas sp. Leaf4]